MRTDKISATGSVPQLWCSQYWDTPFRYLCSFSELQHEVTFPDEHFRPELHTMPYAGFTSNTLVQREIAGVLE
jgi:hypothetical protein